MMIDSAIAIRIMLRKPSRWNSLRTMTVIKGPLTAGLAAGAAAGLPLPLAGVAAFDLLSAGEGAALISGSASASSAAGSLFASVIVFKPLSASRVHAD